MPILPVLSKGASFIEERIILTIIGVRILACGIEDVILNERSGEERAFGVVSLACIDQALKWASKRAGCYEVMSL